MNIEGTLFRLSLGRSIVCRVRCFWSDGRLNWFLLHVNFLLIFLQSFKLFSQIFNILMLLISFSLLQGEVPMYFLFLGLKLFVFSLYFFLEPLDDFLKLLVVICQYFILLNFFLEDSLKLLIFLFDFFLVDDLIVALLEEHT